MSEPLRNFQAGLRCHDVHAGLRNVDPNSATLAPLADTRMVGMAASPASLIRGQDVVSDAASLKTIVAEQLDISPYAFSGVIDTLERAEMIYDVERRGQKIISFNENVPYYENLYSELGDAWRRSEPSQLEQGLVAVVDRLAMSPVPAEQLEDKLGLDRGDVPRLIEVGKASELVQGVPLIDGEVLYSPFYGFENPQVLADLLERHGSGLFAEELQAIRSHQGLPVDAAAYPALTDAVARGFLTAPSVRTPEGQDQPFATLPYVPDQRLLPSASPYWRRRSLSSHAFAAASTPVSSITYSAGTARRLLGESCGRAASSACRSSGIPRPRPSHGRSQADDRAAPNFPSKPIAAIFTRGSVPLGQAAREVLLVLLLRMRWPALAQLPLAVLIRSRLPSGSRSSISHP